MIVEDQHFRFLVLQRGALADLAGDRDAWAAAYVESLERDMVDVRPALPVRSLLDVGGGLSGISVLINRESGGGLHTCILDGADDEPRVRRHDETFSSMTTASDFLRKNGVVDVEWRPPCKDGQPDPVRYDLILSLQAWCFHFPPEAYIDLVEDCVGDGTAVILDVRRDRPDWRQRLEAAFGRPQVAYEGRKFERLRWGTPCRGS